VSVQPRVVWMPGAVRTEIHLAAEHTGGAFCLLVDHPPAGWSLPAHLHRRAAETMHILDGEFEIEIDGQRSRVRAGETLHVPADTVHSTANVGATPGRRLLIFSPAGMERFFLEAGARSEGDALDARAVAAAAARHGWEFVTRGRNRQGADTR
jgi:quercetin dioxygenase-like cupin family protein